MVADLLPRLEEVRQRGSGRWSARCPAHPDKSPSLSISEGKKGVLLRCWAGCSFTEICNALSIEQKALFFDGLSTNPRHRQVAVRRRADERAARERIALADEAAIDTLREAERFVASRQKLDISWWSDQRLSDELNALADAYHMLAHEDLYG